MAARRLGKATSTLLRRLRIMTSLSRRRNDGAFLGRRVSAWCRKCWRNPRTVPELTWGQYRDQAVQLHEIVLYRRRRQHEHIAFANLVDELPRQRAAVLEFVGFVDDEQVVVASQDGFAMVLRLARSRLTSQRPSSAVWSAFH